jgi:recombinational DNA repair protein RecR
MDEREARVRMNEALFRAVNERIEDVNQSFATLTDAFEVVCECGNAGCVTQIRIASDAYERVRAGATLFIVVPGHETAEIEEIVDRQDAYYVVRKEAEVAKRVAEKTDPRSP